MEVYGDERLGTTSPETGTARPAVSKEPRAAPVTPPKKVGSRIIIYSSTSPVLAVATPSSEVAVSTPLSLTLMSTRMPAASRRLIATWRIALSHRALLMLSILTMVTSTFRHTGCRRNSHLEGRLFAGVEFGYSHGQRHGRGHSTRTDRGDTFKRLAVASIKKVKESIKNVKGQG